MTRTEQAEKLLTMIKGVADSIDNQRISGMIDKYFKEIYNFRTRNIDVITIPVGQTSKHSHFNSFNEEDVYYVPEFIIGANSVVQVLDKLHTVVDRLEQVAHSRILVGIRQISIEAVNYVHPNYYFGDYSVSCLDKDSNCWSVDLNMQPVTVKKYETTTSKNKPLGDLPINLCTDIRAPASSNRVGTSV